MKQSVYQHSCYFWYSCHFYCYIGGFAIIVTDGGGIVVVVDVFVVGVGVEVVVVIVVSQPPVRMT